MRQQINEEVSVVMYYSARKREAMIFKVIWQNQEYTLKQMGYIHPVMVGMTKHYIFSFTVQETDLCMRLNFDTGNLHWTLEAVHDGLAD